MPNFIVIPETEYFWFGNIEKYSNMVYNKHAMYNRRQNDVF